MATENRWSLSEIQKTQLEDPDIRPILKMKLNSADRPSWQEIAHESPATKRYWALWNSLYLKDGVLYRKWESNDGGFYRRQLILPNCRIQEVLRETHVNTSGRHFGVMTTLRKTRERFYWDRLRADVEKWCWECQACGARKGPKTKQRKSVTGRTPAKTFSDWTLRFPCDILFGRPRDTPSSPTNSEARLESVQASAGEQVELSRERMKIRYDSRATDHHFKEGDLVWMYNPKRRRGLSPKLQQNWEGPYTIVKKLNDVVYRVQRSPNAKPKVIHINRLAPYRATDHSSIDYVTSYVMKSLPVEKYKRQALKPRRELEFDLQASYQGRSRRPSLFDRTGETKGWEEGRGANRSSLRAQLEREFSCLRARGGIVLLFTAIPGRVTPPLQTFVKNERVAIVSHLRLEEKDLKSSSCNQ
ncbi:hypothetical protein AVEN_203068-1 [Araneus ventricosus]|uniref:RNA-directed DNA polymerase n=1 Tax=Araneus ventricosus TaxID=182803 RepID=A0A4Y2GD02_ARAVE|nr:hypothetical protein AVEN_203068-1 [Araneus ventricosus]